MTLQGGTWVEHFGHTCFAIERENTRLLFDPILARTDLDLRIPVYPEWRHEGLDRVRAVFISHGHDDHLHPPSLLRLPRALPIYYFDEDPSSCSCEETPGRLLAKLGFTDCRSFRAGDCLDMGSGISVHAVPARPSTEGEEQVCFLIDTPDATILDAIDIKDDPITRSSLEGKRGEVDIAFVPTGSSIQWQGFWNQMDPLQAVEFCRWLRPKSVAACGGSLSLSHKPQPYGPERYPFDFADWLGATQGQIDATHVVTSRPPFRLHYHSHHLKETGAFIPAVHSGVRSQSAPAVLTSVFLGYDPQMPTRRRAHSWRDLRPWLNHLVIVRDLLANSASFIKQLLERCDVSECRLPAALLAPCTLRWLVEHGKHDVAAHLCSVCPAVPVKPSDLEFAFFGVAEALLARIDPVSWEGEQLQDCLSLDHSMYRLREIHLQLRQSAPYPETKVATFVSEHVRELRFSFSQRRPRLGPYHFRTGPKTAQLIAGELPHGCAGLLCFSSHTGVHKLQISLLDGLMLDLMDGRTAGHIIETLAGVLDLPLADVETALFSLLARLTRESAVLVDWGVA